jgi:hypothetical protein
LTGAVRVQVTVQWTANQNLSGTIELVHNGEVVASQQASVGPGAPATLSATVDFPKSGWLAARRMGGNGHVVHTGAVFVTVNNAPVRASATDAEFYVQWMDNLLQKTSPGGAWSSYFVDSLDAAQNRYQAAKAIYQQIALEAGGGGAALTITTQSLPGGALNVAYSTTLAASGGTLPYTWSIVGGSLPAGLSLNSSTGVISGTPAESGSFSFTVQVTDAGNPGQSASKALSISVATQASNTIWPDSTAPGVVDAGPDSAVELGVKFRSDSDGYITGIRFYKSAANTGTHVANLWSGNGTLLASAAFSGETASGWQQVNFSTPVAITANTVYVASYYCPAGHYSDDQNYFAGKGADSPPLHALADGVSGFNGVYAYGSNSSFPNQGWNSSNYWVDVMFSSNTPPTASYTVWPASTAPAVVDSGPDSPVELGVKFRSDSDGFITGIRFYKAAANTGTHAANLWSGSGALLASATFANETASGWQQANFSTPVAITANTVYVASYHCPAGHYSDDQYYFAGKGVDNAPLHALADGESGFNGVYAYGSAGSFPSQGWNSSNYWVDVIFEQ